MYNFITFYKYFDEYLGRNIVKASDIRNQDRDIYLGKFNEEDGKFGTFIAYSCGSNSQNSQVNYDSPITIIKT